MIFDELETLEEYELSKGGSISYYPNFLPRDQQKQFLDTLIQDKEWKKRKEKPFLYREMGGDLDIISKIDDLLKEHGINGGSTSLFNKYDACYYRNGSDHTSYRCFGGSLAVLFIGVRRRFVLREKKDDYGFPVASGIPQYEIYPKSGSLLILDSECSNNYKYAIPKVRKRDNRDPDFGYIGIFMQTHKPEPHAKLLAESRNGGSPLMIPSRTY